MHLLLPLTIHFWCTQTHKVLILYINIFFLFYFIFLTKKPIEAHNINLFQVIEKDVIKPPVYQTLGLVREVCFSSHLTVFSIDLFFFFFLTNADRSYLLVYKPPSAQMAGVLSVVCFPSIGLSCQLLANLYHQHYPCLSPSIFISFLSHPIIPDRMACLLSGQYSGCLNHLGFNKKSC